MSWVAHDRPLSPSEGWVTRVADLVVRTGALTTVDSMTLSQHALDSPLQGDVELTVTRLDGVATVLGAFQRPHGLSDAARHAPLLRRGSGGPFVTVGDGTLHVLLALSHPGALVPCDPRRRPWLGTSRPLLSALNSSRRAARSRSITSAATGSAWSTGPSAQVAFAHDSTTGRAAFEAFVAVTTPFAPPGRGSFSGKEPGTLASVTGRTFDMAQLVDSASRSFSSAGRPVDVAPCAAGATRCQPPGSRSGPTIRPGTATASTRPSGSWERGSMAAGVFRLGGDLPRFPRRTGPRRRAGALAP